MALLTEIFGTEVVGKTLEEVKFLIKNLAQATPEEKQLMLKEFGAIRGIELTTKDFEDIK
jgi:hypothetical protein